MHLVGHWQLELHTRCEQLSQPPCLVAPAAHTPSPLHVPQLQLGVQVWVPQLPQLFFAPGVHTPLPEHVPHAGQVQLFWQVRDCEPQLPQGCVAGSPGLHSF